MPNTPEEMDEHTPGEWVYDPETTTATIWASMSPSGNGNAGRLIATVWGDDRFVEPNAKLIASAPTLKAENVRLSKVNAELLAALEELVKARWMCSVDWAPQEKYDAVCDRAKVAIERARKGKGETA